MQQILQLNMGLSVVERLKTYDVEKIVLTGLVVFNLILSDVAKPASMDKMCKYSQFQQVSNRSGIEAKSPSSIIFRRFGSLAHLVSLHAFFAHSKFQVEYSVSFRGER